MNFQSRHLLRRCRNLLPRQGGLRAFRPQLSLLPSLTRSFVSKQKKTTSTAKKTKEKETKGAKKAAEEKKEEDYVSGPACVGETLQVSIRGEHNQTKISLLDYRQEVLMKGNGSQRHITLRGLPSGPAKQVYLQRQRELDPMALEIFLGSLLGDIHLTADLVAPHMEPEFDLGFLLANVECVLCTHREIYSPLPLLDPDHREAGRMMLQSSGEWPAYSLDIKVEVVTNESKERLEELRRLVETNSILMQTLKRAEVPMKISWKQAEQFYA